MFKKSMPDIILSFMKNFKEKEIFKQLCYYCIYSTRNEDQKTFFWSKGAFNILHDNLVDMNKLINENLNKVDLNTTVDIESLELNLFALSHLSKDCGKIK